jgi:hypothetical protein
MATAQNLFADGLRIVLSYLRFPDLIMASRVCKTWRNAALALTPRNFSILLRYPRSIPILVNSPLYRRHVSRLTVYSDHNVSATEVTQLSALPHLRQLSISFDVESHATHSFVFPPTLTHLKCRIACQQPLEPGVLYSHLSRPPAPHALVHSLARFFTPDHFGSASLIESLEVDLERELNGTLHLGVFPGLRSFQYRIHGIVAPVMHVLLELNAMTWEDLIEANSGVLQPLQPLTQQLPCLETIDLSSHHTLKLNVMNRLTAFRASLTDINALGIERRAVPYLVYFVKLQRLVVRLQGDEAGGMTGKQLLPYLPRSLIALTIKGIVMEAGDRALFAATLPHLESLGVHN